MLGKAFGRREWGYALLIAVVFSAAMFAFCLYGLGWLVFTAATFAIFYFGDFSKMMHRIAILATASMAAISALLVFLTTESFFFICVGCGMVILLWLWAATRIEAIFARRLHGGEVFCG